MKTKIYRTQTRLVLSVQASIRCHAYSESTIPMSWSSSTRRQLLPANWRALRMHILRRDPVCQLQYVGVCTRVSTEVDHVGEDTDHRPHMLRGVCHACHAKRTAEQARAAIRKRSRRRAPEQHPGVIPHG